LEGSFARALVTERWGALFHILAGLLDGIEGLFGWGCCDRKLGPLVQRYRAFQTKSKGSCARALVIKRYGSFI